MSPTDPLLTEIVSHDAIGGEHARLDAGLTAAVLARPDYRPVP